MILVTGGTGLLGSHLLYFLLKEGNKVRAIHRKSSNFNRVKKVFSYYDIDSEEQFNKIEWVEANITDVPVLELAFKGITEVYHTAAFISFNPKHFSTLLKTNVEGTANIVNLCLSYQIKKLCHVSSIATLGAAKNEALINEENEYNPEDDTSVYAITKQGADMEVWRGTQEGLNAVIVKPGLILGSGHWSSTSSSIFNNSYKGIPYYTTGGVGLVDVQDVVKAMMSLMKSDITNDHFILVGENSSYQNLLTKIAANFQKKGPKKGIPKWALLMYCNFDWLMHTLFKTKIKFIKGMVPSLYTTTSYSSEKIKNNLDFKFSPIDETLQRVCENYLRKS
ncbi:NAD-dependent epimerase/dehydratase family protein [Candidatus Marifrigoribacter sp. Uisw_064]|jgi:dihydroflavonol-4-reductase|uniref:NAD-dependent epimerase/dehydratase family protein n=1 Tax=Candidatus Marifrigoribacter sp. Uisw_064 TaxID=3230970 RepID=UPI003D4EEB6F